MHHAYMGDEGSWRHPDSGLEGRHDEWSQRDASPGRPAGVLLDGATNERQKRSQVGTTTGLQLERDELLMPLLDVCIAEEAGYACVKVREGGVDGESSSEKATQRDVPHGKPDFQCFCPGR